MTDDEDPDLGGELFEAYLRFEQHAGVPDDAHDLYVAEQIGVLLLFIAMRRAGETYEIVPESIENYARIAQDEAERLAKDIRQGADQKVHELIERARQLRGSK